MQSNISLFTGLTLATIITASGTPWVKFFGKSIHVRNFGYDVSIRLPMHTECQGGGGEAGQPLGTGVFEKFPLVGNTVVIRL